LMELRYFRSQISGLMIFSRIDDLLKRRDSGDDELCAIYLMLLSLGFKGSYARNPAAIAEYRGKLYDLLLLMNPAMRRESAYIFPEAYRHTVTEGAPVRLPEPKTWWLGVGAIVAAWLIVSTIGWFVLTRSTRADLKIVNDSLSGAVAAKTASGATSRGYDPMPFETTEAGFKLALDSTAPPDGSRTGSMLIAVYGQDGKSAGSDEDVRMSLLRGVVATPGTSASLATYTRAVLDVRPLGKVPTGLTLQQGTLLFAVDLPADHDSSTQQDLFFPQEPGPSEVNIHALVAYRPVELHRGVQ
jgi:hypothetical protein